MTEIEQQNKVPDMAKRMWHIVRVVYFMVRKGILKRKLTLELSLIMKRGKIARKAIGNLLTFLHHHHGGDASPTSSGPRLPLTPTDYEFSCSNSPSGPILKSLPFFHNPAAKRRTNTHSHFFTCAHAPPTSDEEQFATVTAVKQVLEMLNNAEAATGGSSPVDGSVMASPMLSGFGQSPAMFGSSGCGGRQLRITDSPFPLGEGGGDCHVDEAAEEFIQRFYKELKLQN